MYASYTSIYQPQVYKDANGATLEPVEGHSYETGLKAAWLGGQLNGSLALFRLEQDNVAEAIGTNPVTNEGIYKAIDGATTQGVELEHQHNEHLSVALNANNVFDKRYLSGLGNFDTSYWGEPRNLMLTTRWDF